MSDPISILSLALCLNLLPGAPGEPPKAVETEKVAPAKAPKKHGTVAVPEEDASAKAKPAPKLPRKPEAAEAGAAKPKVKARLLPLVKPEEAKRLAEAEARASRLAAENARLQEALARKEAPALAEIKDAEAALAELRAGNLRFAEGRRVRTLLASQDPGLRQSLAKGQAPFAVIVTCSDSRVMDNLLFDQELGRLFTIREAGNCPDIQGLASVEYAVEHLGSKLVVLLGHTFCGAVKAVQEAGGKPLPGNLWSLQAAMAGLLETTPEDPNEGSSEYLRHLETANALRQAQALLDRSEIVRHLVGAGKLKVVPALYDLESGRVRFLELLKASTVEAKAHH